ncbi:MAG: hypothetical protein MZV70_54490 [Desulfobacterales bacterium]|nr:hypothetical protein [Desulfobacterales bacterium]
MHAAHTKELADELASIGITAEVSPTLFGNRDDYISVWKPNVEPKLYMTVHPGREEEYGLSMAMDIMAYTKAHLYVYGSPGGYRRIHNVHFRGWVDERTWRTETWGMQGACA